MRQNNETMNDGQRKLVESHQKMVNAMVWKLRDCGVGLEDLRQEGYVGLCEAAMRYKEESGSSFATYAAHWCRKMMLLAIERYGAPMQLPQKARQAIRFYRVDRDDSPQGVDDTRSTDSTLSEAYRERADEDLLRIGQQRRIADALECLTPMERQIIAQSYGFETDCLSLTETAAALGLSPARVSVLRSRALHKLDAELRKRPLVDYLTQWLG